MNTNTTTNNNKYKKNTLITVLITLGSIGTTLYFFSDKIIDYINPIKNIKEVEEVEEVEDFKLINLKPNKTLNEENDEIIKDLMKEIDDLDNMFDLEQDQEKYNQIILFDSEIESESESSMFFDPMDIIIDDFIKVGYITV